MDTLKVWLYDVNFGDAILLRVPDRDAAGNTTTRHILIDVGNVTSGEGGENAVFAPVVEDILDKLDGAPLDLYVMTHEHLDHVQGLPWASKNGFPDLKADLDVQHAWLPNSADPDYYKTHADAKKKLDLARSVYGAIDHFLAASDEKTEALDVLIKNNGWLASALSLHTGRTGDCVQYLRELVPDDRRHYVHRSIGNGPLFSLDGKHPFEEAKFEVWAPEENTADYYGHFQPMALALGAGGNGTAATNGPARRSLPTPPSGVDAGAFYDLFAARRRGYVDNMLAIDKAANNSSIVFCLQWRGWKLLFPGDAEIRSWKEMNKEGVLSPIHFLKMSHHGSHNGTPDEDLLAKLVPDLGPDGNPPRAAVSTFNNTYNGIPHQETLEKLKTNHQVEVQSTLDIPHGEAAMEIAFADPSP